MVKIIAADDHAVVRTGLQLIFESTYDLRMEKQCSNGMELLQELEKSRRQYDVVLLDVAMPGRDSFDLLKEIKAAYPELPVIIFTMNNDKGTFLRMIKLGADAFINKEKNPVQLIDAIRQVVRGSKYFDKNQASLLADSLSENLENGSLNSLTDREYQVMGLLASGVPYTEIAQKLQISKNTLSNHRNNILRKLKLTNNAELTRYALENQVI